MRKLHVDVWSDVVCPWCAIGKRRFERALEAFAHKEEVEVVWRAFELDPSAPAVQAEDNATRLAQKYGRTRDQAVAMMKQTSTIAADEGLDFDLIHARPGNTFDAHRVLHLARERGVQDAVNDRFFRGYMSERQPIGDRDALVRLASEAGLAAEEVRSTLASDRFGVEVREEEDIARQLGIRGVPFFLFGEAIGVSGAQPTGVMMRALEQAWEDARSAWEAGEEGEPAVCEPDGCQ
jgi:predicted DsbA family dithiol-disulfide isomerase